MNEENTPYGGFAFQRDLRDANDRINAIVAEIEGKAAMVEPHADLFFMCQPHKRMRPDWSLMVCAVVDVKSLTDTPSPDQIARQNEYFFYDRPKGAFTESPADITISVPKEYVPFGNCTMKRPKYTFWTRVKMFFKGWL